MTQKEIFQNMTKGEWSEMPANTCGIEAYIGDKDISYIIGSFNKEGVSIKAATANNLATIDAVNNTYGKGINPESVERFKKFAETFFNYYSSMEYQLNWDKLAEEHTGGNVDFIAWATGEAQDILFNSRLEAPKIKNHE